MQHEDPQVGGLSGELALDPGVAATPDLAVIEVGLGRVDRDDRDPALAQDGVALAEQLLEVHVADVARVVVPGDDDQRLALDLVEVLPGQLVLVLEPEAREVAGADHDVGLELVDLGDRALEQGRLEVLLPAMQVGEMRDPEGAGGAVGHGRSLGGDAAPVERAVREREYR